MNEEIYNSKNSYLGTMKVMPANNGANWKDALLRNGREREVLGPVTFFDHLLQPLLNYTRLLTFQLPEPIRYFEKAN